MLSLKMDIQHTQHGQHSRKAEQLIGGCQYGHLDTEPAWVCAGVRATLQFNTLYAP